MLFSYPLHAPRKTGELREEEFYHAATAATMENSPAYPLVFVRGENDTFAKKEVFDDFVERMRECRAAWLEEEHIITIPGGDHGLKVKKSEAVGTEEARKIALEKVCGFLKKVDRFKTWKDPPAKNGTCKRSREEDK